MSLSCVVFSCSVHFLFFLSLASVSPQVGGAAPLDLMATACVKRQGSSGACPMTCRGFLMSLCRATGCGIRFSVW